MTLRELLEHFMVKDVAFDDDYLDQTFTDLDLPITAGMHGSYMEVQRIELSHDNTSILLDMSKERH